MMYLLLVILLALLIIVVRMVRQPGEFRVERSTLIAAPPAQLFPYLNNLQLGQEWSPWYESDPQADYVFEGPAQGEGSALHWEGKKTGKGSMTITHVEDNTLVRSRLNFYKPIKAVNTAEYQLATEGDNTRVTWVMTGNNNLLGRFMGVFINCDNMIGPMFEKGLGNLKKLIEQN